LTKQLPSVATLANAAAGIAACAFAIDGRPDLSGLMILAAVLMDSFDGALARSLDVTSDFGAELDSLADMVSFGVAPAVLVGSLLPAEMRQLGWALLTMYPLCTAWRLARFNVSHNGAGESHGDFIGLPSTGAGAASATAVLIYVRSYENGIPLHIMLLPCLMVLLGALMVSRIPYKHAGTLMSRMTPLVGIVAAAVFVAAALWEYECAFAALMWSYVLSGPFATAKERIRAVRHA
jgi:CDP-diacylglycerol--serine O-phosphatidyltransferase